MDTSPIKQLVSTPSRSISTPIVDRIRQSHQNANREFDQFYGYISSKVLSPRRSQQQDPTHTMTPKNTRRNQQLDHHHTRPSSTSLTPLMATHAIQSTGIEPPTLKKQRRDYPPPRAMTLTPNSMRSSTILSDKSLLHLDNDDDDDDDDEDNNNFTNNVYLRSPRRTTTASNTPTPSRLNDHHHYQSPTTSSTPTSSSSRQQQRFIYESPLSLKRLREDDITHNPPPSPSLFLQDQLLDETRRLEQLQKKFDRLQQRCLALSFRSPIRQETFFDDEDNDRRHTNAMEPSTSPSPYRKSFKFYDDDDDEPLSPPKQRKHTSPAGQHLQFSIPSSYTRKASSSTPIPQISSSTPKSLSSRPIPQASSSTVIPQPPPPPQPQPQPPSLSLRSGSGHQDVLSEIPKAQLKSAKTITTSDGTRIKNKFWTEIHGHTNNDDDTSFWMNDNNKKTPLTDRLEQAKSIPQQASVPTPTSKHYPSDFFEELTWKLKGNGKSSAPSSF